MLAAICTLCLVAAPLAARRSGSPAVPDRQLERKEARDESLSSCFAFTTLHPLFTNSLGIMGSRSSPPMSLRVICTHPLLADSCRPPPPPPRSHRSGLGCVKLTSYMLHVQQYDLTRHLSPAVQIAITNPNPNATRTHHTGPHGLRGILAPPQPGRGSLGIDDGTASTYIPASYVPPM